MLYLIFALYLIGTTTYNSFINADALTPVIRNNLNAYTWEDEDWPNEPFGEYLDRCMQYQMELQPFKKRRSSWNVLNRYHENKKSNSNNIIGNDFLTWENLQLLQGKENNLSNYLVGLVDRTSTGIGSVTLCSWIAQPTDDIDVLKGRQANVRALLKDECLYNDLKTLFERIKNSENLLYSFWINDPFKHTSERNYFKLSRAPALETLLNENPAILTASTIFDHKKRIFSLATTVFATVILPLYGIKCLMAESSEGSQFDTLAERLISSGGPIFGLLSFIENPYVQAAGFIGAGTYCGLHTQEEFDWTRDNFTLVTYLQTKLHHVMQCINAIEEISNLINQHPEIISPEHKAICDLLRELKRPGTQTHKLFSILKSTTFESESSLLSNYGNILVAYRLMHQCTHEFEPLLCALGELDVYMSIARLYKEFEHQRVHYTFPVYDTQSTNPVIIAKNVWNPFINPEWVIPNSITLGANNIPHNLIITGPNEGGKSTFVKSVAISMILAQSLGIVPADEITITPFSYIATYLNITDDHGKSLFEAQVQRAKHIIDHIDSMEPGKFSFVIIDELFNGTEATVGQATSYSIANYFSKNPYVVSIFPTHFPQLTKLEKTGLSVNYKVSACVDSNGIIKYPYAIEKGISDQNIVLDIMRNEEFNSAIIDQAEQQLHKK